MFRNFNAGAIGVRVPFEEACKLAAAYGFQGIDVGVGDIERLGSVEAVKDLLGVHRLHVGGFGLPGHFLGSDEDWKQGLRTAPRYLEMGRKIGATRTFGGVSPSSDTRTYQENFDFYVRRLKPVALVLEDYGFRWGFEFLGPKMFRVGKRYEFIFDLDSCLDLCNAIRDANCGLLLDVWHWYTSGGTMDQIEKLSDRKVIYMHINDAPAGIPVEEQVDNVRCLPGDTGVIDVVRILKVLHENGCTAPVTVEPFNERVNSLPPEGAGRVTTEALGNVWEKAGLKE
ncbi:MAG: sugar phosphate isomerase/epimerase [Candidatus Latescibacteria bacterium]|nr:sugar phosphate isomerase/epimerase [Candidatus Latescibacterota bacterium]